MYDQCFFVMQSRRQFLAVTDSAGKKLAAADSII